MRHRIVRLGFLAIAVIIIALPTYALAEFTPALKKLISEAKAGGEVALYVGSPKYTAAEAEQFSKEFEKCYGIPMKIKLASLGSHPKVRRRLIEEAKAGIKPNVDVFVTSIKGIQLLDKGGVLKRGIDWRALGVNEDDIMKGIGVSAENPIDAVYTSTNIRGVMYNTKLVKRSDAPRKFEDLLDPKWKGKIISPGFPTVFPYIALVIGEEKAIDLVKRLVDEQNMAFAPTISDVSTRVANGEFLIGYGYQIGDDKRKGAPIENAPMKVAGFRYGAVVMKETADPAAAKLLVHFITTAPQGMKVCLDILNWGKRSTPGTEAYEINQVGGLVLSKDFGNELEWESNDNVRIAKRFKELLGL